MQIWAQKTQKWYGINRSRSLFIPLGHPFHLPVAHPPSDLCGPLCRPEFPQRAPYDHVCLAGARERGEEKQPHDQERVTTGVEGQEPIRGPPTTQPWGAPWCPGPDTMEDPMAGFSLAPTFPGPPKTFSSSVSPEPTLA